MVGSEKVCVRGALQGLFRDRFGTQCCSATLHFAVVTTVVMMRMMMMTMMMMMVVVVVVVIMVMMVMTVMMAMVMTTKNAVLLRWLRFGSVMFPHVAGLTVVKM